MLKRELMLLLDRQPLHGLTYFQRKMVGLVEAPDSGIGLDAGIPGITLFLKLREPAVETVFSPLPNEHVLTLQVVLTLRDQLVRINLNKGAEPRKPTQEGIKSILAPRLAVQPDLPTLHTLKALKLQQPGSSHQMKNRYYQRASPENTGMVREHGAPIVTLHS